MKLKINGEEKVLEEKTLTLTELLKIENVEMPEMVSVEHNGEIADRDQFDTIQVVKKNDVFIELDVWLGKKNKVQVSSSENYYVTIPKRKKKTIKAVLEYKGPLEAPIRKGDKVASLNVYVSGELNKQIDLFSAEDIKRSNIFSRVLTSLNYLVWGDV